MEENNKIDNENKTITCYSLIALKYGDEEFEHYFEKDLETISEKTGIAIELLEGSIWISEKTLHKGFFDWAVCDKEYSFILATKQSYVNTEFSYARDCYRNLITDHFIQ